VDVEQHGQAHGTGRAIDLAADRAGGRGYQDLGHGDLRVELGGARRELGRVERLALADVAGPDGADHEIAQRQRRAQLGQQPVDRRGRIIRVDARFARAVAALVDGRPRRREFIGHGITPPRARRLVHAGFTRGGAPRNEPGTPGVAGAIFG
jgi:hypothetical protein